MEGCEQDEDSDEANREKMNMVSIHQINDIPKVPTLIISLICKFFYIRHKYLYFFIY